MKSLLIAALAASVAVAGAAQASESLAKDKGCLTCHNLDDKKKMGPGFKAVSAKYKGKAGADAGIVEALATGKGHPKTKASEDELKTLTKWILSL